MYINLIVLYGPPCSGKSTIARHLVKRFKGLHISTDSLRIAYIDEYNEMYKKENVGSIYKKLFYKIDLEVKTMANKVIVVEGMFLSNTNKLKVFGLPDFVKIDFFYITSSITTLKERLSLRNKNDILQINVPLSPLQLEGFYNSSRPPTSEDLIINTDTASLGGTLQKVMTIVAMKLDRQFYEDHIL